LIARWDRARDPLETAKLGCSQPNADASTAAGINIDLGSLGVPYEGIGSLSGGGGDTRLLIDYPEATKQDILDILFKPNVSETRSARLYGLALQITTSHRLMVAGWGVSPVYQGRDRRRRAVN